MKKITFKKIDLRNKGFTLLFAVLVASLLLAIGLSIANLTIKEIQLSGTGRESQFAFYASDTGIECGLYWDIKGNNVFATSSSSVLPSGPFLCAGEDISTGSSTGGNVSPPWTISASDANDATTTFQISFLPANPYCAIVKVGKSVDANGNISTTISSRGYNTCDTNSTLRTERGLQVTY